MRLRAQDHDEEIERRMATAEAEIRQANTFDFRLHSQTRDEDFAALLEIVAAARAKAARG
jgi:guanylate kinase